MRDSSSNCISALPATTILGRLLFISSSLTHKRLEGSRGGQVYLLALDPSQICNFETPSTSFQQLAKGEARGRPGMPGRPGDANLGTSALRDEQF